MVKELTDEQFKATMASKMLDVTASAEPVLDIWPYVATLEKQGIVHHLVVQKELVEYVYRSEDKQFDHVLLPTSCENKFVTIVIDVKNKIISGYYNLDLTAQYF